MRAALFPDSEAVAVLWMRAGTAVTVATDMKGWLAPRSRIVITRIGGVPSMAVRIDNPRLDVDVYAASKEAAHDLAQLARVRLHELPTGDHTALGAVVAHVADDVGLHYIPDPDTQTPRYVFTLRLAVRPHP